VTADYVWNDRIRQLSKIGDLADLVTPMAVRVAVTLGIPDLIHQGYQSLEELRTQLAVHPRLLAKLLAHLVALDLLNSAHDGDYRLTSTGHLLVRDDETAFFTDALDLEHVVGQLDMAVIELLHTVRTGEAAYGKALGHSVWEHLDSGAYSNESLRGFVDHARVPDLDLIVNNQAWAEVQRVVDVGGNTGTLVEALLTRYHHLSATLIDLNCFADLARTRLRPFGDRCLVIAQSFFDPLPENSDAYLLSGILADWSDDYACKILANCAGAVGTHGRIVVSELHLTGKSLDPVNPTRSDLAVETAVQVPDRTIDEIERLAAMAGLTCISRSTSKNRSLLELRKDVEASNDIGRHSRIGGRPCAACTYVDSETGGKLCRHLRSQLKKASAAT